MTMWFGRPPAAGVPHEHRVHHAGRADRARVRQRRAGGPAPSRFQAAAVPVVLASVLTACSMTSLPNASTDRTSGARSAATTLVAAGDVACGPDIEVIDRQCQQEATADLVESLSPDTVLVLGDTAYEQVTVDSLKSFDVSWGRFLDKTQAVVGNHEYYGDGPDAYWDYFGDRSGPRGEGWYSFDVGAWHVVVLNSECAQVGCDADSDQGEWLAADLADNSAHCTLAAFHRPRFSSGGRMGRRRDRLRLLAGPAGRGRRRRAQRTRAQLRTLRPTARLRTGHRRGGDGRVRRGHRGPRPARIRRPEAQQRGPVERLLRRPRPGPVRRRLRLALPRHPRDLPSRPGQRLLPMTPAAPVPVRAASAFGDR